MSTESVLQDNGNKEVAFVQHLRDLTQQYLRAVDAWEEAYFECFRLVTPHQVSSDLGPLQRDYERARRKLEECVPQGRRMCWKYGVRDPWEPLLRIRLGANSPQSGAVSAIGKGERNLVAVCLADLEEAAWKPSEAVNPPGPETERPPRGIVQRIVDFFF